MRRRRQAIGQPPYQMPSFLRVLQALSQAATVNPSVMMAPIYYQIPSAAFAASALSMPQPN
jgi:hypothetical protein